ncbi:jg21328 [Pararge aegeria aegeria]|uniref:Jg21328 protein n=1 Tax=Pararge aegeria aegeria TaxID=348720 RepID=A0A8S4QYM5_9NEOP|nr:jg21328 [Pararge aegeria aegeria]
MLQAITSSWKEFCNRQEKETMWQSIYRITIKCLQNNDDRLLRSPSTNEILSPQESVALLAQTFFLHDDLNMDTEEQKLIRVNVATYLKDRETDNLASMGFTHQEVENALMYMSPKKTPGEDGLTADICQKAFRGAPEILLALYNKCFFRGFFPKIWKNAALKVIPKPNRDDYAVPKAYRPIGLLPILGKVLEKLISNRILWQLGKEGSLSANHFGFMPQSSTEDALYAAMEKIRQSRNNK